MLERKQKSIPGGNRAMHLSVVLFFVSFGMAVFAVYTYQRASDTVYERLVLDLHATKSELSLAKGSYDLSVAEMDEFSGKVEKILERVEALERGSGKVSLEGTARVEVTNLRDLMRPTTPSPKNQQLMGVKPKQKRMTQ